MLKISSGFTLVEAVIVLLLTGILAGVGATLVSTGFKSYLQGQEVTDVSAHGRLALARMTRDLRDVRPAAIQTATATNLVFTDRDGNTITYSRSGTLLLRRTGSGTARTLAEFLDNSANGLKFSYWMTDGKTAAVSTTTIRYITISVLLNFPALLDAPHTLQLVTTIHLPNP
jgi:Tfp pilus assembly protein PilE